jgi:hypothetical protein
MVMPDAPYPAHVSRGRLRKLFDQAWQRARARRRRLLWFGLLAAVIIFAIAAVAQQASHGPGTTGTPAVSHLPLSLRIAPSAAAKHDRIVVTITAAHATGAFGRVRRGYYTEAQRVRPDIACVNNRSGYFPATAAGNQVRAALDPAQGDGGPEGWCPGAYRGTVSFAEGFNCASVQGPCHPPPGFPHRSTIVARFSYRVH